MITKVLLVGMMGSGKSTVGTALAARLGWPYLDNDALLERTTGSTARQIEQAQGGDALLAAELRVLTLLLGMPGPLVGGVAGGVVLDEGARGRIRAAGCHVVWLRTSVPVLVRRVGNGGRARLGDDPAAALRQLAAERHPWYEELADEVVDTDALPVGAIAKQLAARVTDPVG